MKQLRTPGLGPIVGHTTDTSARVWIRAGDPADDGPDLDANRRSVGVAAIVKCDGSDVDGPLYYFRLHREFDRTGTFVMGVDGPLGTKDRSPALDPDRHYEIAMGSLTLDDPYDDDENVSDKDLAARLPPVQALRPDLHGLGPEARAKFRTFPKVTAAAMDRLVFLFGSCRYPGLLWNAKRADRIFGPMSQHVPDPAHPAAVDRARFILMVGDQIYADLLNLVPLRKADTYQEFQSRYITAFGSRNMRQLLRSVPHYMILDDHEIEDNWTQDRLKKANRHSLFTTAMSAYLSYQWSHGPRTWGRKLFYKFDCSGYGFFVLDTRTQRTKDDVIGGLDDNHLLGRPGLHPEEPAQIDCLLSWLRHQHETAGDRPKFIVTPSVFVPNDLNERQGSPAGSALDPIDPKTIKRLESSDAWPAYPSTRRAILQAIVEHNIQNVVFLGGDVHCSNVGAMTFKKGGQPLPLRAYCITSSAFYWPFPFADGNPSDFVHDSTAPGQEDTFRVSADVTMDYKAWNFTQDDNFCRLTIDKQTHQITVNVLDANGEPVIVGKPPKPLIGMLDLAAWV